MFCDRALRVAAIAVGSLALILSSYGSGDVTVCSESNFLAALKGGGLVRLLCDGTLTFTNTLQISSFTKIDATGHTMTISANNQARLFSVDPNVQLSLIHLTLANGNVLGARGTNGLAGESAAGAGIYNRGGSVFLDGCSFTGHVLAAGAGGAGVQGAAFDPLNHPAGGNGGSALGGAIYNVGSLTMTNCTFSGATVTGGAGGNGVAEFATGNGANGGAGGSGGPAQGGAIFNGQIGTLYAINCSFFTNNATGGNGGAGGPGIGFLGFPGKNGAAGDGSGAAIFNAGGSVVIVNSTFAGNAGTGGNGMPGGDGILAENGTDGSPGGGARGGAVFNSGSLAITNCTCFGNFLIGGNGGKGGNGGTTGFGGDGGRGGDGGPSFGGALFNTGPGKSILVNCTFSQNSVRGGTAGKGGTGGGALGRAGSAGEIGAASGAAVFSDSSVAEIKNSIIASSLFGNNLGGTVTDLGFNLNSDQSLALLSLGSTNSINPLLGVLTNNGGLTLTMAIATNSPAVDAIRPDNGCPPFDQRGAIRTNFCDIGAFELNGLFIGPKLQLAKGTNTVLLAWPVTQNNFGVETSTNAAARIWQPLPPTPPVVTNNFNTLSLPVATNQNRFFRLRRQ